MTDKLKKLSYKKIILLTVAILFMGLVSLEFWKDSQTYTVVQGERNNGFGTSYGYELENYRYSHGMILTLWTKLGSSYLMKSIYEMPRLTIDKVGTAEWIKSDGAIFLKLRIIDHSSLNSIHSLQIIYDYHIGQMYVNSDLNLWRIWSSTLSKDNWLSEKQFDEALIELQQ